MPRLSRARADDRLRFVAVLWVGLARAGLHVLSLPRLRALLTHLASLTPSRLPAHMDAEAIGRAVLAAQRAVPRASCLVQALAAEALLLGTGHPAEVHLSASLNGDGEIAAHAWVSSGGVVVVGGGPSGHQPLAVLPPVPQRAS